MNLRWLMLLLMLPCLCWGDGVGQSLLLQRYQQFPARAPAMPLEIQSSEQTNVLAADVFGVVDRPYQAVAEALADPAHWCEFMPLTLNIKACTYDRPAGGAWVTFYAGRKFYEPPQDAYQLRYRFEVEARNPRYLRVVLAAAQGPMGTRDYRIVLEAMPAEGGSFVRVHSSYRTSLMSRAGTETYLATLGRDKVGFTVDYRDRQGTPVYTGGLKGVIERNAVRYFLALQTFMAAQSLPAQARFEARIQRWFDLTEAYPRQLHELERHEYLQAKRREWANQRQLQQVLAADAAGSRLVAGNPAQSGH